AFAAFGGRISSRPRLFPYGICSVPEVSFVGSNERELRDLGTAYVSGVARYGDLMRGAIAGDRSGLLKLLVRTDTRQLLGVHAFGTLATELIHLGQTAIAAGLQVDYFASAVFNLPTFAEAYKVAALDAVDRLVELGSTRGSN